MKRKTVYFISLIVASVIAGSSPFAFAARAPRYVPPIKDGGNTPTGTTVGGGTRYADELKPTGSEPIKVAGEPKTTGKEVIKVAAKSKPKRAPKQAVDGSRGC